MEDFYRHFCDIIVESLRMFNMSEEEAVRRCRAVNPEMLDEFHRQGRSVLIVAGHYNNWELAALSIGLQSEPASAGVYHPLSNQFINDKFQKSRRRFGMELVAKKEVKPFFEKASQTGEYTIMLGADQAPHNPRKAYWAYFLGQETPIMFGTEKYAQDYGFPVVFGHVRKLRRGYYEMEFELITDQPESLPYGEISERHTRILERDIRENPQYWLWTHRRWKRERPADVPIHRNAGFQARE